MRTPMFPTSVLSVIGLLLGVALLAVISLSSAARGEDKQANAQGENQPSGTGEPKTNINAAEIQAMDRADLPDDPLAREAFARPLPIAAKRNAMIQEIQDELEKEKIAVLELARRIDLAKDENQALKLQRELGAIKSNTELAILNIQLKHAQKESRLEDAATISAALEKIQNPPKLLSPSKRSVPGARE